MAGGNLGDLWFQLGVKDNTSKELQKIIDKLKTGDDAANALLRALQGFGTKKSGFKEQAEKAKEFADVLNEINRRISKLKKNDKVDEAKDLQLAVKNALSYLNMLQRINIERSKISELRSLNPNVDTSKLREAELMLENINNQLFRLQNKAQGGGGGGVDSAKVLQDYAKVLQMTFRDVKQITDQFKKENPLSAFSGGAAKVEADIARVTEKLARMRDLMAEGALKGFNTNMLGGSITELDKILARLQAASGNKSILTDAAQMKNLLSDVAVEMTKAAAATQAYGREKGKVIAQEREFAAASKLSAKDNDAELKALSDYAKRYMALQEAKRKAEKQASDERKRQSAAEARRIEADTERMSRLYAKMSLVIGRGERAGMRGLELGVNTSALEKALSEATELKRRIEDANIALMGKGGRPSYSSYAEEVNRLSSSLANATQAQRDLNSAQDKANRKAEAQATRDAAKAKRDDAAAERQRQREIEISTRRMERLDDVLVRLRKEYGNSVKLQVDTTQIETKIKDIENQFNYLKSILQRLGSRDSKALGLITNVGDQREVQLANRVADAQRVANREAQRGVELEQKRQQEIAQSAAKARNDLAAAFAGANAEAKKMQSIVGDIKSLFLQGGIVFGAQQFFNSIVRTGGEIVQQHIALRSILGDVQKADELFDQTQQLALQSPFKFGELNRDVKQLAAFGVEANDLYDTTKRLADIASGLGVDFSRLGLAFGQVKARSWLDGKELRQFAYAGLPLLEKITELYNAEGKNNRKDYTQSDVKEMISKRMVSFEDVQKVLWKMTDEGGQFYNMQFVLSETLLGKWNKLIDAWEIMLGKFADGDNIVGGFFKLAISGVTELVLALDKMSPAILSMGAVRLLGMLGKNNFGFSKLSNRYTEQLNTQLKAYAIEQQQLVAEKKITQEKALQNVQAKAYMLADKESQMAAYSRMALEGKLSVNQMNKLRREGLITEELVQQLTVMGLIDAEQERVILGGSRLSAIWSTAKTKFNSALSFVGGWWGLAIGAAVGIWSSISQEMDEVEQKAKNLQDANSEWMKPYYDILSQNKSSNDSELKKQVDSMKQLLISSDAYTKTIDDQIKKAKSLNEQYDILKNGVESAKNTAFGDAGVVANAIGSTGGIMSGKFNDTITENINDMHKSMSNLDIQLSALDENTRVKMESIANSLLLPADRSKTLADKIRILSEEGGQRWSVFQAGMVKWNSNIAFSMTRIRNAAEDVTSDIQEIANDDVPAIVNSIQKDLGLFGNDFRHFCKTQPDRFRNMLLQIASDADWLVPQIRKKLEELTGFRFPDKGKITAGTPLNSMQRRVYSNLGGNQKQYDLISSYLEDGSYYKTKNNLQNALQDLYNEYKSRSKGGATKVEIAEAKRLYDELNAAAFKGVGYKFIPQDKKSNKVPKVRTGSQKDKQLDDLKERLSSLKSARQMYQKYQSRMSDEEAKKKTYKLFPEVTGLNLDDYQKAVHSLLDGFKINTTERKKFQTSVYREVAEWIFDEKDKKEYERKAADFNESMNKLSERWDLYKSLLEKTGSEFFAQSAWVDAFQMDDKAQSMMDEYYAHYHEVFNLQDSLKMTDGEAKEKLKLPNQYEEWKKITDLLRSNYVKSLQDGADAMQQTMSVAKKLDSITEKYDRKRKNAGANQDLIDRYNFLEKQEKSGVLFDQMKSEVNWDGVFGDLGNYTKKELKKIRKDINSLISGGLLNGMSTTDIKSVYDGLGKLNQAIDGEGFSGLSDLLKDLIDASEKYDEAVNEYNESVKKYGTGDWHTDQARKAMLQAEQRRRATQGNVNTKKNKIVGNVVTLVDMFKTLGASNGSGSTLLQNAGGWTESIMKMSGSSDKNSSKIGGIVGMFAGLTEVIAEKGFGGFLSDAFEDIGGAVNSIFKDTLGINLGISGADYSDYNKAKAEYENLTSIWDSLISKKTEYMNIHWGTEATAASKEAKEMLEAEVEQTKIIAQKRLNSGSSAGSHSIWYRMWKGSYKYNGQNWRDVAGEISSKYGVQFNGMEDMLNMNADTLSEIKKNYIGLWSSMDSDFREYLEKLIQYGEKADDMIEALTEKLTGNKFSDLVSSWGDAMATMANTSDSLVDHFENNLKKTVLNSMIENLYKDKINALLEKTKKYGDPDGGTENIKDSNGNVISEYTGAEYADIKNTTEELTKQIEATRDFLKKTYGWSDNSSSSSRNSVKGITEEEANLGLSYLNEIRLDCSVMRAEQAKYYPEMSEIAKSQLTQLNSIAQNTLRNADAAERIDKTVSELNDNFNRVLNGTRSLKMK